MRVPIFENDKVRVWRSVIAPDDPLPAHSHDKPRVVIPLQDVHLKRVQNGSDTEDYSFLFRQAYWEPAEADGATHEVHANTVAGDGTREVMVVEIK
jgi:hypothetical protein